MINVCPTDVFVMYPTMVRRPVFWLNIKVHDGKQTISVNKDTCILCIEYVKICPELAIEVGAVPG